jgi:hypothetical protein
MMAETGYYQQPTNSARKLYSKANSAAFTIVKRNISTMGRGDISITASAPGVTGWPMHYPTHSSSQRSASPGKN